MYFRRARRLLGTLSFLGCCALAHASSPGTDVTTFSTDVRNFNLVTLGNATFTSSNDFQGGLAVEGNLILDGNTIMSGGGTGYVSSSDPSLYVTGTMTLNGGSAKMNGGYASTPNVGSGWTFSSKRLTAPSAYGSGILDSTNSSASQTSTSPISNPAPSSWSWSTLSSSFASISSDLASATATGTITVNSGQNLLLTTTVTSGVAVFTLDCSKFSGNSYNGSTLSNVQISPPTGVDYVINVINASGKTLFPSGVNVNSGSNSGQILWNFVGSGTVTLGGNTIYGAILAPSMSLVTSNTICNGQVVCASFSNSASELHYTVFVPKAGSNPAPSITSSLTASATQNQSFSYTITASGSPTSYGATNLPTGVTVNSSTGVISGTPTTGGNYSVTISATNAGGTTTATLGLTVDYILTVTAGTGGTAAGSGTFAPGASAPIVATANSGYTFSSWSGSGVTSTTLASTTVKVTSTETVTASFKLNAPVITSALTASDIAGQAFSYTITATNSPTSYNAINLPAGLSVNTTTGVISGAPTTGGTYNVTISATNAGGTGSATLVLTVNYTLTVVAGANGSVTGGGTFAAGANANISGTANTGYGFSSWTGAGVNNPSTASTYVVVNSNETVTGNFVVNAPVITSALAETGVDGQPFTYTITATNSPTSYNATGMPTGLTVNTSTGVIAGTPTDGGIYNVTISATNAGGTGSATLVLTVNYTLGITGSPSAGGTFTGVGTYAPNAVVNICETPASGYRTNGWSGSGPVAPNNASTTVTMSTNRTISALFVAQGTITVVAGTGGTATGGGTFDVGSAAALVATANSGYTFTGWTGSGITNANAASTSVTVSGNETVTANFAENPPVITSALTATGVDGSSFTYGITATNSPTSYNATGLPAGLSVNASTGVISGTPTVGGVFNVTISATNSGGTGSATLVLTVDYTLTITGSPASGGTFSGGGTYGPATMVNISETAASNYRANGWGGANSSQVTLPTAAATTIRMNGNYSLTAQFVAQGTLTVNAGTGGTATGSGTYDLGSNAAISATPSTDYVFSGWTGSGVASPSSASTTVAISASSQTATAAFTMQAPVITSPLTGSSNENASWSYAITATHHPSSYNAVGLPTGLAVNTSSGGISGSPTQYGTFNVTISATNAGGTGSATLVLTVTQMYALTITALPSAGGSSTGAGSYAPGTVVNISESANTGYRTNGWSGSGVGSVASASDASTTVTMNSNVAITASFVPQGVLTVNAQPGGTASGGGTFDLPATTAISATANTGYVFTGWTGPGLANANSANTTVSVSGNQSVTACFVEFSNPEQLGTIIFPNAVASGQPGVTPTTSSMTATVTNGGTNPETISSIATTGDYSPTVTLPFTLGPGQSQNIPITFAPSALGLRTGLMTGVSTDPSNPCFQFTLEGTGVNPSQPPTATISAPATAYSGSPVTVSSTAFAPMNNLTLHSIEWMSPDGTWNVNTLEVSGGNSSRTLGVTFPTTGVWTLRAGASTDNGATWYYSSNVAITIKSGLVNYSFESMAVPSASMTNWYSTSPIASKTYEVQEVNPGD